MKGLVRDFWTTYYANSPFKCPKGSIIPYIYVLTHRLVFGHFIQNAIANLFVHFENRLHAKKSMRIKRIEIKLITVFFAIISFGLEVFAQQMPQPIVRQRPVAQSDSTWWYIALGVLGAALVGAIIVLLRNKKTSAETKSAEQIKQKRKETDALIDGTGSVDAEKEMEWLRQNHLLIDKRKKREVANKKRQARSKIEELRKKGERLLKEDTENLPNHGVKDIQVGYSDLPIHGIYKLEAPSPFEQLPISHDEHLLDAIYQTHEEDEEDEMVRELAVKILAAFCTQNSVEALSQVALYDLSAPLRVKALIILGEFDHESVFESVLLACADPSREVRAAAARTMINLSFDRPSAWVRIIATGEYGRMRQAARAAIESGFVERSIDRLLHNDLKQAYESYALLALLIKSGETELIFQVLENHKDVNVRLALLHVLATLREPSTYSKLYELSLRKGMPKELDEELKLVVEELKILPNS